MGGPPAHLEITCITARIYLVSMKERNVAGCIERPELLPDCDVPASRRKPDEVIETSLVRLADETQADNWRTGGLRACQVRGGAALAAASFMVQTPGPFHEGLQRIAPELSADAYRPSYTYAEYTVGLCYIAGTKGLPPELRLRAAAELVARGDEMGYAEARNLLPRSGWGLLTHAVREGWAVWTAQLFAEDETVPLRTRMKVGLALAEHDRPAGYVPEAVEKLVAHPDATSADRLALASAVAQRAPKESVGLLCRLASDPLVQPSHRMQAIELLDEVDAAKSQEMRALQTRLPTVRAARDQHREAAERAEHEVVAQRARETPEAVLERLDSEIQGILDGLDGRGSADWLATDLDNHLAETDWAAVAEDVAEICGLVRDEDIESALRSLEVLTRIRYGDDSSLLPDGSEPVTPDDDDFPRLTRQELAEHARDQAQRSWTFWGGLVEKHGWDTDRIHEVDDQWHEVNRHVSGVILQKAADHLRNLQQCLVWEIWPALVKAAKERNYGSAWGHLATARLLTDEAEHSEALWKETTAEDYSFDPMTMSWPRDVWLALEAWRRG
ncbi:hypothetical protein GCM10022420_016880 [Streptomyces iranensis]